jgi:hypothetical protein
MEIKITYAINTNGKLININDAIKEDSYRCVECNEELIARMGEKNAKHYSHKTSICNPESLLHKTAKIIIANIINNQQNITINLCCKNCNSIFGKDFSTKTFSHSNVEHKIGSFICDVVAFRQNQAALGIEILATHKVDEIKSQNLGIPWIELKAVDVIENPNIWNPINFKLKETICSKCLNNINELHKLAEKFKIDKNIYTTDRNPDLGLYIIDKNECFNCKNIIPVFWWKDVPFCQIEPKNPKPHTIKYKYSKNYGGSYWANTCPNCNSIQGDNFLFLFNNAKFKDLPNRNIQKTTRSNTNFIIKKMLGGL